MDAVIEDGNGVCIPEGGEQLYLEAILSLCDDPLKLHSLGVRAAEFTKERFAIEPAVQKYAEIFCQVQSARKGRARAEKS